MQRLLVVPEMMSRAHRAANSEWTSNLLLFVDCIPYVPAREHLPQNREGKHKKDTPATEQGHTAFPTPVQPKVLTMYALNMYILESNEYECR